MVSDSRACLTFILSDHPYRPSRHFDRALATVKSQSTLPNAANCVENDAASDGQSRGDR